MADTNSEYSTVLGSDAVFTGQLKFEKSVQLLGKFEGEITSGGQLLVADGATLTGNVKAEHIKVDGVVKGNLDADQKVELSASARMEGDLSTSRLEVAEGAVLVGRCMVGVNGHAKSANNDKVNKAPAVPPQEVKGKPNTPAAAGARK